MIPGAKAWRFVAYGFAMLFLDTSAQADVSVRFTPIANFAYQLDCISGVTRYCSREVYQELWTREFIRDPEDTAAIKQWAVLSRRYDKSVDLGQSIPGQFEGVQLNTKLRIASLQASSLDDLLTRYDLLTTPADRAQLGLILYRFFPRFEPWWNATAAPAGEPFATATQVLLTADTLADRLQQFEQFYAAKLPANEALPLHLMYRPEHRSPNNAEQIEGYAVAEFLPNELSSERLEVVLHELCHYLFSRSSVTNRQMLQQAFSLSPRAEARGAYALVNEAIATALGNGVIGRQFRPTDRWQAYFARPLSLYNDHLVDSAAKAALPLIDEWLRTGRTLYDPVFPNRYIDALKQSLGSELTAPSLLLREAVLIADDKYGERFSSVVVNTLRTASLFSEEGDWSSGELDKTYTDMPTLSALVIVHPSNLAQLKRRKWLPAADYASVAKHVRRDGQVLYAYKRASNAPGYVIVAPDRARAISLIENLAAAPRFEGAR